MRNFFVNILEYVLVSIILIEFNTPYLILPSVQFVIRFVPMLLLFVLILLKYKYIKFDWLFILIIVGAILPLIHVRSDSMFRYVRFYMLFFPFSYLYLKAGLRESLKAAYSLLFKLSSVVLILSVVSLFFWIFGTTLNIMQPTATFPYEWDNVRDYISTYYGLYFETQHTQFLGVELNRNSGIFCEAPMYNMILCIALSIELYLREEKSKLRILILSLTIISTFTTTGQFFLIINIFLLLYRGLNKYLKVILFVMMPFVIVGFYMVVSLLLIDKKQTIEGESSVNSREKDIELCIKNGLENPILGKSLFYRMDDHGNSYFGYSNSIFTLFAHGGIYTILLYVVSLLIVPFLYYIKKHDLDWLLLMICFFILFAVTMSHYRYLTIFYVAFNLTKLPELMYKRRIKGAFLLKENKVI